VRTNTHEQGRLFANWLSDQQNEEFRLTFGLELQVPLEVDRMRSESLGRFIRPVSVWVARLTLAPEGM